MIKLVGEIDKKNVLAIVNKIEAVSEPTEFWMSTCGGANAYSDLLTHVIRKKLKLLSIYIFDECSSNGQTIFFNFPIEKRYAIRDTYLAFHNHNMSLDGTYSQEDLKKMVKDLQALDTAYYRKLKHAEPKIKKVIKEWSIKKKTVKTQDLVKHGMLLKSNII